MGAAPIAFAFFVLFAIVLLVAPRLAHAANVGGEAGVDLPLQAAHLGMSSLVGVYAWVTAGQRAHRHELEKYQKEAAERCAALEAEVARLKERDAHTATAAQIAEVLGGMRELRATVKGFSEVLKTVDLRFARYEEHMLMAAR